MATGSEAVGSSASASSEVGSSAGLAGRGAADESAEVDVAVVIGEALHHAVAPRQPQAAAERGRARVEPGLQGGWDGAHGMGPSASVPHALPPP